MKRHLTFPYGSRNMGRLPDTYAVPAPAFSAFGAMAVPRNDAAFNATLKAYAVFERDDPLVEALAWWVARMRGPMMLCSLLRMAGLGQSGFAAAVVLLDEGRLVPVSRGRICNRMLVAPPASGKRDALEVAA